MADVDATLAAWSSTTASNKPTGPTTIGTGLDDNLREIQGVTVRGLSHKGSDIASAATTDLGAVEGLFHDITGTTTITSFGTVRAGIWKVLKFEGALTLTHNATSLIIPGGANITTADGDMCMVTSEGSGNWRLNWYIRANGEQIKINTQGADVASASTINLDTATGDLVDVTGTTTITAVTLAQGKCRTVRFTGILTFTHGASLVLPGSANITTAAGDFAILRGYASSVVRCIGYFRADGTPVTTPTAAQGSSLVFISTASASSSATIDFTSGIDGTYDEYLIIITDMVPATGNTAFVLRVSEDSGSTFKAGASDYAYTTMVNGDGAAVGATGSTGATYISLAETVPTGSTNGLCGEVRFWAPTATTHKKFLFHFSWPGFANSILTNSGSGLFQLDTNTINGIRFLMTSGNITSGRFALYGVKKA